MRTLILLLAVVLLSDAASSQYLPLELETTIPLPSASNLWDVIPHPDGYYVWIQVLPGDPPLMLWGRTDSTAVDSFALPAGTSRNAYLFLLDEYNGAPHVLYGYVDTLVPNFPDYGYYRAEVFDLVSGSFEFLVMSQFNWYHEYSADWYTHLVACLPWMPAASTTPSRLCALFTYCMGRYIHYPDHYYEQSVGWIMPDIVDTTGPMTPSGDFILDRAALALRGSGLVGMSVGYYTDEPFSYYIDQYLHFFQIDSGGLSVHELYSVANTLQLPRSYCIQCTFDTTTLATLGFTGIGSTFGAFSSLDASGMIWTSPIPYDFWLVAECVGGNSAEEFLCYNRNNRTFDVWAAATGQWYGHTDTITIPTDGGARIVGRYDNGSRRLVFRDSQELKLYRFGEYLPAGPRRSASPSEFVLGAFPNPFNPSTTISFSLPREARARIAVFDILGREVAVLADNVFTAGEHRLMFDGSSLPSGLYFARLQSGTLQATHKLLLMK